MFLKKAANISIKMASDIESICNIPIATKDNYKLIQKEKFHYIYDYCIKNDVLHITYILGKLSDINELEALKEVIIANKSYYPLISVNFALTKNDQDTIKDMLLKAYQMFNTDIFNIYIPPNLFVEKNILNVCTVASFYEKKGCRLNIYTKLNDDNYEDIKKSINSVFREMPNWRGFLLYIINSHWLLENKKQNLLDKIINETKNLTLHLLPIMDKVIASRFPQNEYCYPSIGTCPIFRTTLLFNHEGLIESCKQRNTFQKYDINSFSDFHKSYNSKCPIYDSLR